MTGNGGSVGNESDPPAATSSILTNEGKLDVGRLSEGMFTLRLTKDGDEVIFLWISDRGDTLVKRIRQAGAGPGTGVDEYLQCLSNNADKGMDAVAICLPKLFE